MLASLQQRWAIFQNRMHAVASFCKLECEAWNVCF